MKRILIIIFLAVQLVGFLCSWKSFHPDSSASALLWGTGFVLLFPGNMLGSTLIEKTLWESHLPTLVTDVLTVVAVVAVNSILWFVIATACSFVFGRRRVAHL